MKIMNLYKLMAVLLFVAVGFSCVQDDEFDLPNTTVDIVEVEGNVITIDALRGIFEQAVADGDSEVTFTAEDNLVVEGYVVSSDEGGNWFEEIVMQDKAENPTTGVKVLVDVNPLFTRFEKGRKILVKLDGLTVAVTNGVLGLGLGGGDFIDKLPPSVLVGEGSDENLWRIFRTDEVATIVPRETTLAEISASGGDSDLENVYIRISDVQFNRNDVLGENPLTFAAEPTDEFDGDRTLEGCEGGSIIVQTSTFADFKALFLPNGRGAIDGILSRDFFDDFFTMVINEPADIAFGDVSERCDPDFTACTGPSGGGSTFFSEDFEGIGSLADLVSAGWTNVNTVGGSTEWVLGTFSGNNYAQITAFSSGEDTIESWLVTPGIDMDGTTAEELMFDVQANFDNGTVLSVLFSNNFTGDPTTADWNLLDATIPVGPSGGFGDFEAVGPVNVSCLEGTVHFAFLYTGSESGASTRYHVDNVEVTGI